MDYPTFTRIITSLADKPADLDITRGKLIAQVKDDIIEAKITLKRGGDVEVCENGTVWDASTWIIERICKLRNLAERITEHLPEEPFFVGPHGQVLDSILQQNDEKEVQTVDIPGKIKEIIDRRIPETSVVYLTSDAGEGKTTIINKLAKDQARLYRDKKTDWLLLPISLGGRPFMRFDEVIVASLITKYRFSNAWYYETIIELVRLGAIVIAFDGFEEMFVEGNSDEAMSGLSNLLNLLNGQGNLVVAARKAYFEYNNAKTIALIRDSLSKNVVFSRIKMDRWNKDAFLEYAQKRGVKNAIALYEKLVESLGDANHPLLTRAVLVKKLIELFIDSSENIEALHVDLKAGPASYFETFVRAIVHREATEKWVTRGMHDIDAQTPLLTVEDHFELLSLLAEEMWRQSTTILHKTLVDEIVRLFCEGKGKAPNISRQISERIKEHALFGLTGGTAAKGTYAFDHDEFYEFFLGLYVADCLQRKNKAIIKTILGLRTLPRFVIETACLKLNKNSSAIINYITELAPELVNPMDSFSNLCDNMGAIAIGLLLGHSGENKTLKGLRFPPNALNGNVSDVIFENCQFESTTLAVLKNVKFMNSTISQLVFSPSTNLSDSSFQNTQIFSLLTKNQEDIYSPEDIQSILLANGCKFIGSDVAPTPKLNPKDDEYLMLENIKRFFFRSSHISDSLMFLRLRSFGQTKIDEFKAALISNGVLVDSGYSGGGADRHYKLGISLVNFENTLRKSAGSFETFIKLLNPK